VIVQQRGQKLEEGLSVSKGGKRFEGLKAQSSLAGFEYGRQGRNGLWVFATPQSGDGGPSIVSMSSLCRLSQTSHVWSLSPGCGRRCQRE
jgi:hypothetical protein